MSGPNASNMKNLSRAMIVFSFLVTLKLNSVSSSVSKLYFLGYGLIALIYFFLSSDH